MAAKLPHRMNAPIGRRALLRACGRAALGAAGLALAGCAGGGAGELQSPPWGYSADNGPARWAGLDPRNAACAGGDRQSPVDIAGYQIAGDAPPAFSYQGKSTHLEHLATTVHVQFGGRNVMTYDDGDYVLRQIHWHTPAEHQLDGRSFPMEMHLVHARGTGEFAVVGIFHELGPADEAVRQLIDAVPPGAIGATDAVDLDAADFTPDGADYFAYGGSLTTPPCSEVVSWLIMRERRTISDMQLAAIRSLTGGDNNRPVQPVNDRAISLIGA